MTSEHPCMCDICLKARDEELVRLRKFLIEEIKAKLVHPDSPNYNDYWKYLNSFLDDLKDGRK